MRRLSTLFVRCILLFMAFLAHSKESVAQLSQPKVIVGIVVDQMRYDYLYRYAGKYGPNGFNRLLREGFSCENTRYSYMPTYTAPGHAAIYTGTSPSVNGIISNDWWDPEWKARRYVTVDKRYRTVGASGSVGQHSPSVLLSSTITDELRLFNNFHSKVAGVCLKDRGSILPAGHFPDACYWFDDATGNWITSSYYPDSLTLPSWVQAFNAKRLADKYLAEPWTKMVKNATYEESFFGWNRYAGALGTSKDFPYDLPSAQRSYKNYSPIRYTPFGNTLTLDFALEVMDKMDFGADAYPDFMCLSFSSTDYCGHLFGVHSEATEDTYLRLDLEIARLLNYLDQKVGKGNALVFLSADHGAAETPVHLQSLRMPSGVMQESPLENALDSLLRAAYGKEGSFVLEASSQQIWFDRAALQAADIPLEKAQAIAVQYLRTQPGVYDAYTKEALMHLPPDYPFAAYMRRGIHPRRSGDVFFMLDPAWHADDRNFRTTGTTHGSPYAYDAHVPLLWHGWNIRSGRSVAPTDVMDIAPTLAALLHIMEPNGTTGKVIEALFPPTFAPLPPTSSPSLPAPVAPKAPKSPKS